MRLIFAISLTFILVRLANAQGNKVLFSDRFKNSNNIRWTFSKAENAKFFYLNDRSHLTCDCGNVQNRDDKVKEFNGGFVRILASDTQKKYAEYLHLRISDLLGDRDSISIRVKIRLTNSSKRIDRRQKVFIRKLGVLFSNELPERKGKRPLKSNSALGKIVEVPISSYYEDFEEVTSNLILITQNYKYVTFGFFDNRVGDDFEIMNGDDSYAASNSNINLFFYVDELTIERVPNYSNFIFLFDISKAILDNAGFEASLKNALDKYITGLDLKFEGVAYRDKVFHNVSNLDMFAWLDNLLKQERQDLEKFNDLEIFDSLQTRGNTGWKRALSLVQKKAYENRFGNNNYAPIIYISDLRDQATNFAESQARLKDTIRVLYRNSLAGDSIRNYQYYFINISGNCDNNDYISKERKPITSICADLSDISNAFRVIFNSYTMNISDYKVKSRTFSWYNENEKVGDTQIQKDIVPKKRHYEVNAGIWSFDSKLRKRIRDRGILNLSRLRIMKNGDIKIKSFPIIGPKKVEIKR